MNKAKKEQLKRFKKETEGMTRNELISYQKHNMLEEKKATLARRLHALIFSESYEFMGDSILEAKERKKGINPMRAEIVADINNRRELLGISKLKPNGMEADNSSLILCNKLVNHFDIENTEKILNFLDGFSVSIWKNFTTNEISLKALINQLYIYGREK